MGLTLSVSVRVSLCRFMFLTPSRPPWRETHARTKITHDPCLWLSTSHFPHTCPVCSGFASWLTRWAESSAPKRHWRVMGFPGAHKHTHTKSASPVLGCFCLLGTNVVRGGFAFTKMRLLLMQVRGEMKNTLWKPLIESLIIYFLPWDLFTCSSWFKNTRKVSTRITQLKTNLWQQQNQIDRNRTIAFFMPQNANKQCIVLCVLPLFSLLLAKLRNTVY